MRIVPDREVCVGAGMCVLTASELFDQDAAEGLVTVLKPEVEGEEAEWAREAVLLCPAGALTIDEDD